MMSMPVLALLAASAPVALPPDLAKAVAAYDGAQVKGDGPALGRLLADDYLLVNSDGEVETKAQFITDLTDPRYKMRPFTVTQPIERVWANGAVMGGVARLGGTAGGKPFSVCLRFADIWSLRAGRWQVAYTQAAKADPAACL